MKVTNGTTGSPEVPCLACGEPSEPGESIVVRGRQASLYRCGRCGLRFFPDPDWLAEAYEDPIAEVDVGLVSRCVNWARLVEAVVRAQRLTDRPHLDYGGGYGLMTRLVRDRGLDMRHYDPYAPNLFAKDLEGSPEGDYGCISLIEVLEHLPEPADVLSKLSGHSAIMVVSTALIPRGTEQLADWWYLLPDLGQHVTLYTKRALAELAAGCGMQLASNGQGVHVLHRDRLHPLVRLLLRDVRLSPPIGGLLRARAGWPSLRDRDGAAALDRFIAERRATGA